ncbi:hypothetical protein GUJ93_ZPchr0001g32931 [Zizania palustris]|uniref:Uncharacterized protein n=1 Tax=Zizania palustris TaxID=103762 RepID=A0A8J5VDH0_ZIZPA|nr:hypothetical protein GUJ93_ZPchr0001g32931 [Zizania palustris]
MPLTVLAVGLHGCTTAAHRPRGWPARLHHRRRCAVSRNGGMTCEKPRRGWLEEPAPAYKEAQRGGHWPPLGAESTVTPPPPLSAGHVAGEVAPPPRTPRRPQ